MTISHIFRRGLFVSAAALTLPACTSILPDAGELAPRYALDPGPVAPVPTLRPLDAEVVVSDTDAESVYNTFNVAVATAPLQFEYLQAAEWTDRVPVLFRRYVERRFENAQVFTAVGDRSDLPVGDYDLKTDLRAFHLDRTSGTEAANVTFSARLVDRRGKTVGAQVFTQTVPVQGLGRVDQIAAIDEAANRAVEELIVWTHSEVADSLAAKAAAGDETRSRRR